MTTIRFHSFTAAVALAGASASAAAQGQTRPVLASGLTLVEVLDRAAAQHPLVDAARARVRSAEGSRLTARSLGNPLLTMQVENAPFPGRNAPAGMDRELSTFATLPLEPLFQRVPRVRRATEDVRAAEAELDLARRAVSLDASRAFYRVALAQSAVDGAADVLDRLSELATYTGARVKEGATSEGDLIRVQVELDRADASVTLDRVELARARGALAPYLGGPTPATAFDSIRVVVDTSADSAMSAATGGAAPLAPLEVYVARASMGRADLVAARARSAAARAETDYQRTLALRQIGATFGSKRIAGVNTMIAGLTLPLPLFDQNRGEVQRASGERSALEHELAWRERQVAAEVAASYEATRLLGEQRMRLSRSFLDRAEMSRRIALAAYREGAMSLLQVIDASRTLADARLAWYRTLFAERESLLELNVISGGELPGLSPATSPVDAPKAVRAAAPDGGRP